MSVLKKRIVVESKSTNLRGNFVINVQLTRFRFRSRLSFCVRLTFFSVFLKRWYFSLSSNSSFWTKGVVWAAVKNAVRRRVGCGLRSSNSFWHRIYSTFDTKNRAINMLWDSLSLKYMNKWNDRKGGVTWLIESIKKSNWSLFFQFETAKAI